MKLWSFGLALLASVLPPSAQTNVGKTNPRRVQNTNEVFTSGIRGSVVAGPISPVERPGVPSTRPLPQATIVVQTPQDHHEIKHQKADGSGRFQIALPPGKYLLTPHPAHGEQSFERTRPQQVTVETNKFTEVTLQFDTGIR